MPFWRPLVIFFGASPNCNLMFRFAFHGNKVVHTLAVGWSESRESWRGGGKWAESVALSGGVWKPNERCNNRPFWLWSASASLHTERDLLSVNYPLSLFPSVFSLHLPSLPLLHLLRVCLLEAASFFACGANWLVPKLYKNWNRNEQNQKKSYPPSLLTAYTLTSRWEIRLRLDCIWEERIMFKLLLLYLPIWLACGTLFFVLLAKAEKMFVIKFKYLTCNSGTLGDAAPATTRQFRVPKSHEISTESKKKKQNEGKGSRNEKRKKATAKKKWLMEIAQTVMFMNVRRIRSRQRERRGEGDGGRGIGEGENCGCNVHAMRQQFCNLEKAPPHTEYAMR